MPRWMHPFISLIVAAACFGTGAVAHAVSQPGEGYIAGYGGLSFSRPLTEVHGTGSLASVELTNLSVARSPLYGIKLGGYLPGNERWLGIETELFYANPHIRQQDIGFTVGGVPAGTTNFTGAHVRVTTWAINWLARYPGKVFQPYVGVGPAIVWGRMSGDQLGSGSDTSLGFNALAGFRILLGDHLGLFAEYKYNRVSFDFGGTAATHVLYQPQQVVGGLAIRF